VKIFTRIFMWLVTSVIGGFIVCSYGQKNDLILLADPRILAVSILDNQEPMIDLKHQKVIAYGPSPEIPNNTDYTKLRKTIYEKIKQAQILLPKGLHFCLYEGYRSLHLQKTLFDNRFKKVKTQHPGWSESEIFIETTKLVSPVINQDGSNNIPPHSTGGAIDVYLVDDKGQPIDMGILVKDWMNDNNGSISLTSSLVISAEAQKNREIMSNVLAAVGFINYPTEYWHWSYGDRYWAYHKNESHALYGDYKE
jgi:D-alanyl-D-alanine dipeptidase